MITGVPVSRKFFSELPESEGRKYRDNVGVMGKV